jgi:DNA adenine methylase
VREEAAAGEGKKEPSMSQQLQAPFPWFGGKRRVAAEVWRRFGKLKNYVEPFYGSGAVMLCRPDFEGIETINDLDGYVANFWRSIKLSPDETAQHADSPVNENDLHARHVWLLQSRDTLSAQLNGDPDWHDSKIAGWWVWGISCWIGSGWCSGNGPWWPDEHGRLVNRQRPHLGDAGQGVNRQRPHLGDASRLGSWFDSLAERLRSVRVCSGDWSRVCGPSVTLKHGLTGVFLDPPYADTAGRDSDLYREDSASVAHDVRDWAVANGDNPKMRISLCGYEGEHEMPATWECLEWKAHGGLAAQSKKHDNPNAKRERIWFSPHCLKPGVVIGQLFDDRPQPVKSARRKR